MIFLTAIAYACLCFIGAVAFLALSQQIRTFEGELYAFDHKQFLFTGGLAVLMGTFLLHFQEHLPHGMNQVLFLLPLVSLFSVQWMIDLKYHELADEWNVLLFLISLGQLFLFPTASFPYHIWTVAILTGAFFLVWFFFGGMGLGDVKFLFATGLLFPAWDIPSFLMLSFTLALLVTFMGMIVDGNLFKKGNMNREFAFGPYLITAAFLQLF